MSYGVRGLQAVKVLHDRCILAVASPTGGGPEVGLCSQDHVPPPPSLPTPCCPLPTEQFPFVGFSGPLPDMTG